MYRYDTVARNATATGRVVYVTVVDLCVLVGVIGEPWMPVGGDRIAVVEAGFRQLETGPASLARCK